MTKNELLSFIAFKNEQEKEEAEFYMAVKGVELHRRILLFLGCSFSEKAKIKWSKIARILKTDKALRDVIYIYLATLEEYMRAFISNKYEDNIQQSFWIDGAGQRQTNKIKANILHGEKLFDILENTDLGCLIQQVKNLPIEDRTQLFGDSYCKKNLVAVKELRNATTDVDLDGEGSWKAIYLELNNPCPLEGTTDETKGETEIKFTKIAMVAGEKQAPEAPGYAEVKEGVVYWERVFAASEYELEVDGNAITDLTQRTRPSGDAPMMCRAYKPTDEKAFEVGTHIAKIRSKNSAGVSEWNEFTFTVAPTSQEEAETFRGIKGQGNNQYNATKDFYTATINADKSVKIGFTAAATDEWSTYLFNFDTATIAATKLRIKVRLVSGNLKQVRFQIDRWDSETSSSKTVYGDDLVFVDKGEAELTIDVESEKLAASNGSVMLFLNKYATAGEKIEIEIKDVSLF